MGYQTTSTDEPHILDAPLSPVEAGPDDGVEAPEHPVGYVAPADGYQFNPVADPVDHEMPTEGLHRMELPRHDRYADENTGAPAERVVPYTATGANPSYPGDALPGIGDLDVDVPIEMVQTPEEGWDDSAGVTVEAPPEQATEESQAADQPDPADIPPPPDVPKPDAPEEG